MSCQEIFYQEGYGTDEFDTIPVPSNWQDHGYGLHQYTNTRYPFPFDRRMYRMRIPAARM